MSGRAPWWCPEQKRWIGEDTPTEYNPYRRYHVTSRRSEQPEPTLEECRAKWVADARDRERKRRELLLQQGYRLLQQEKEMVEPVDRVTHRLQDSSLEPRKATLSAPKPASGLVGRLRNSPLQPHTSPCILPSGNTAQPEQRRKPVPMPETPQPRVPAGYIQSQQLRRTESFERRMESHRQASQHTEEVVKSANAQKAPTSVPFQQLGLASGLTGSEQRSSEEHANSSPKVIAESRDPSEVLPGLNPPSAGHHELPRYQKAQEAAIVAAWRKSLNPFAAGARKIVIRSRQDRAMHASTQNPLIGDDKTCVEAPLFQAARDTTMGPMGLTNNQAPNLQQGLTQSNLQKLDEGTEPGFKLSAQELKWAADASPTERFTLYMDAKQRFMEQERMTTESKPQEEIAPESAADLKAPNFAQDFFAQDFSLGEPLEPLVATEEAGGQHMTMSVMAERPQGNVEVLAEEVNWTRLDKMVEDFEKVESHEAVELYHDVNPCDVNEDFMDVDRNEAQEKDADGDSDWTVVEDETYNEMDISEDENAITADNTVVCADTQNPAPIPHPERVWTNKAIHNPMRDLELYFTEAEHDRIAHFLYRTAMPQDTSTDMMGPAHPCVFLNSALNGKFSEISNICPELQAVSPFRFVDARLRQCRVADRIVHQFRLPMPNNQRCADWDWQGPETIENWEQKSRCQPWVMQKSMRALQDVFPKLTKEEGRGLPCKWKRPMVYLARAIALRAVSRGDVDYITRLYLDAIVRKLQTVQWDPYSQEESKSM